MRSSYVGTLFSIQNDWTVISSVFFHSTNEELQATLQELGDLQRNVNQLAEENEQLGAERMVLLESLCTQTEKLENARTQIEHLKALMLTDTEHTQTEREQELVNLLKVFFGLDDVYLPILQPADRPGVKKLLILKIMILKFLFISSCKPISCLSVGVIFPGLRPWTDYQPTIGFICKLS